MTDVPMFYVAEPRDRPGNAFASLVADGKFPRDDARTIADWVRRGALVRLVDGPTMQAMMKAWSRAKRGELLAPDAAKGAGRG